MFSDEEVKQCETPNVGSDVVRDIMAKTAELRGGAADLANAILAHSKAQGARVAVLEKERDDLVKWMADVTEALCGERPIGVMPSTTADAAQRMNERLHSTEESVRELTRRAQQAEAERDNLKKWLGEEQARARKFAVAGQVLSEHVDRKTGAPLGAYELARNALGGPLALAPNVERCDTAAKDDPQRWPCSPTCTHDDSAKPGHSERVKERGEAVNDVVDGGPDSRGPVRIVDRGARREIDAYEQGAEAMRAACLNVVQIEMEKRGASREEWEAMKSAIEGATP